MVAVESAGVRMRVIGGAPERYGCGGAMAFGAAAAGHRVIR